VTATFTRSPIPTAPVSLAAGVEMPTATFGPLTRTDFVRYAGASGDFHPLHHDEPYAQSLGMPSVFGMGLLHAGILGDHLARWVGPENLRSFAVRFTGQVWPGDVLTFTGRVDRIERTGDTAVAHLVLAVTRQTSDPAITATATATTAPDPPLFLPNSSKDRR
jgi:acyl dehydratase